MSLTDLWLPILVSAIAVFVVSSLIHMAIPIHAGDMRGLPDEDRVLGAMRDADVRPGFYMFPWVGSMKDMGSDATRQRYAKGPVGFAIIRPDGMPSMGKALGQWFVQSLVVGAVVGYLAGIAFGPAAAAGDVFRFTAAAAWLGHAGAVANESVWKGMRWAVTWKFVFDGLLYGLATGGVFAWLWPTAA